MEKSIELLKPYLALYIGENNTDVAYIINNLKISLEGHQASSTISFDIANEYGIYDYFINNNMSSIVAEIGYHTIQNKQIVPMKYRIFTGFTDLKDPSESKNSPRQIHIEGRDISCIARDSIITGKLTGKTVEQMITDLLNICYSNQDRFVFDDRESLELVYSDIWENFEIDQMSVWDAVCEIVNAYSMDIYTDVSGVIHICEFAIDSTQNMYQFTMGGNGLLSNIASWKGHLATPSSVVTTVKIEGYKDALQETVSGIGEGTDIPTVELGSATLDFVNISQKRTEWFTYDRCKSSAQANYVASRKIDEIRRQLQTIEINSQYGIPTIKNTSIFITTGIGTFDGLWWCRNVSHSYSKDGGYGMTIYGERPPNGATISSGSMPVFNPPPIYIPPQSPSNSECPPYTTTTPGGTYDENALSTDENGNVITLTNGQPSYLNRFGKRMHPSDGKERHHDGVDIDGSCGTEIRAVMEGVVISVGNEGDYGYTVRIKHPDANGKWVTLYAHLSSATVRVGDHVVAGVLIGYMGQSGNALGCHLHFELQHNGVPVDPAPCIPFTKLT